MLDFLKSLLSGNGWGVKLKADVSRQIRNMRCELVTRVDPARLEICQPFFSRRRAWPLPEKICIFHLKENGLEYYERP